VSPAVISGLRGKNRAPHGSEAWAVFADVCVGAGALWGCPQAVPTGEASFDGCRVAPVAISGDGNPFWSFGERADAGLGQIQCSFVFGPHGRVEQPPVLQAHLG
jgi:hypothetical protein